MPHICVQASPFQRPVGMALRSSLPHSTLGVGLPVAVQCRRTWSPSRTTKGLAALEYPEGGTQIV